LRADSGGLTKRGARLRTARESQRVDVVTLGRLACFDVAVSALYARSV